MSNPVQRMPGASPAWASDAGSTVEPSAAEKAAGWPVNTRPPARWQNFWQRTAWQLLDILYETLLKDWRQGAEPDGTSTINALGWHNGAYYCESGGDVFISVDCVHWTLAVSNPDAGSAITITSNGSRIVLGAVTDSWYSDDDGASWTQTTGPATNVRTFYLANADIWIGTDAAGSQVSTDGITFTATSPVGAQNLDYVHAAENDDGTIVLVSDIFSTDQGATWAAQANDSGIEGYFYSELISNFIMWENTGGNSDLYSMSGTAGTWNLANYAVISDFTANAMFELRGVMFVAGTHATLGNSLLMSRDLGLTWEPASGLHESDAVNPVPPSNGTSRSGEFIAINTEGAGATKITTPPFAGTDFAAVLAP